MPSDNNAAERSLRHLVTSRKISGGTRSGQGTDSKMTLASLFGTWRARGLNPLLECRRLLDPSNLNTYTNIVPSALPRIKNSLRATDRLPEPEKKSSLITGVAPLPSNYGTSAATRNYSKLAEYYTWKEGR